MINQFVFVVGAIARSGGTERVVTLLANDLDSKDLSVTIVSLNGPSKAFFPLAKSIKTLSLLPDVKSFKFSYPTIVCRLRKMLRKKSTSVVITVETMACLFTIPALANLPHKHVAWEHFNLHNDSGQPGRRVARWLAAKTCDRIVTLTDYDNELWKKQLKPKCQVVTIPNPVSFTTNADDSSYHDRDKIVLAVGRLTKVKGFHLLLRAWQLLGCITEGWTLVIVGDGEEKETLISEAARMGFTEGQINFIGEVNDVSIYYKTASIFCLSSLFEGFPMVLLEAIAYGLPVVSFDCKTGPSEILNGTENKIVEVGNEVMFARELAEFIGDDNLRYRVSKQSYLRSKSFNLNRISNNWIDLVKSI